MKNQLIPFFLLLLFGWSCQPGDTSEMDANPPAPGFFEEASDKEAIQLADDVMASMGGRKAWDQTRYVGWNFFGRRYLIWDKKEKRARIDDLRDSTVYLINLVDETGTIFRGDQEIKEPALADSLVDRGIGIWINDSYWLVMPFKLKDSGVTLTYQGIKPTTEGKDADVLSLVFEEVGNTPQNKYLVYIDQESRLVSQWDYYSNREDSIPRISTPWKNYQPFGKIMLSGDRGQNKLTNIRVWDEVPEALFTKPQKVAGYVN